VRAFGHMHGGGRAGNLQLGYTGARATHISSPRPWDLKPASMSAWPRFFIMPVGSPVCAAADRSVGAGVDPARARILLVSSLAPFFASDPWDPRERHVQRRHALAHQSREEPNQSSSSCIRSERSYFFHEPLPSGQG
jgi:hypothetical protein